MDQKNISIINQQQQPIAYAHSSSSHSGGGISSFSHSNNNHNAHPIAHPIVISYNAQTKQQKALQDVQTSQDQEVCKLN